MSFPYLHGKGSWTVCEKIAPSALVPLTKGIIKQSIKKIKWWGFCIVLVSQRHLPSSGEDPEDYAFQLDKVLVEHFRADSRCENKRSGADRIKAFIPSPGGVVYIGETCFKFSYVVVM